MIANSNEYREVLNKYAVLRDLIKPSDQLSPTWLNMNSEAYHEVFDLYEIVRDFMQPPERNGHMSLREKYHEQLAEFRVKKMEFFIRESSKRLGTETDPTQRALNESTIEMYNDLLEYYKSNPVYVRLQERRQRTVPYSQNSSAQNRLLPDGASGIDTIDAEESNERVEIVEIQKEKEIQNLLFFKLLSKIENACLVPGHDQFIDIELKAKFRQIVRQYREGRLRYFKRKTRERVLTEKMDKAKRELFWIRTKSIKTIDSSYKHRE